MPHDVIMPALGMSQDTAHLISWLKHPGDSIKAGDALMEVETDKAVMEVEAQADGFLTSVSATAGDQVAVGSVVAVIAETADAVDSSPATDSESKAQPTEDADSSEESLPAGEQIIMPTLGMAQDTGLIIAWHKKAGDPVAADEILFEVETDKSVMEVEAGHDGYVAAILSDAQQAVPTGSVIAIISAGKPDNVVTRSRVAAVNSPASDTVEPTAQTVDTGMARVGDTSSDSTVNPAPTTGANGRILASPKARRLALERGLSLELLAEQGVPQPYHVADLETLQELSDSKLVSARTVEDSSAKATAVMQITARVPASGCDDFVEWMANDESIDIPARLVWLRFAAAALRQATANDTDKLIVEVRQVGGAGTRFADADKSRLSQPLSEHDDLPPDLILRDFTDSPITSASAPVGSAAMLTIRREYDDYMMSFDYRVDQIDDSQAIHIMAEFADRLGEPLFHLL